MRALLVSVASCVCLIVAACQSRHALENLDIDAHGGGRGGDGPTNSIDRREVRSARALSLASSAASEASFGCTLPRAAS